MIKTKSHLAGNLLELLSMTFRFNLSFLTLFSFESRPLIWGDGEQRFLGLTVYFFKIVDVDSLWYSVDNDRNELFSHCLLIFLFFNYNITIINQYLKQFITEHTKETSNKNVSSFYLKLRASEGRFC